MFKDTMVVLFYLLVSIALLKAFAEAGSAFSNQSTLAVSEFAESENCYALKAVQNAGGSAVYPYLNESCSYG